LLLLPWLWVRDVVYVRVEYSRFLPWGTVSLKGFHHPSPPLLSASLTGICIGTSPS
jgi:hypothetical protein